MSESMENNETKAERFVRVAEKRTIRVLDSLRLLAQSSNRRTYEYNDNQVRKIFREIRSAVNSAEASFTSDKKRIRFSL